MSNGTTSCCGPASLPICVYRGDTLRFRLRLWKDEAGTDPVDLADATPAAEIRSQPDGALCATFAVVTTLPNILDLTLPASEAAKCPKRGAWDLQLVWPGGDVRTVAAGPVTTRGDVTMTLPALRGREAVQ